MTSISDQEVRRLLKRAERTFGGAPEIVKLRAIIGASGIPATEAAALAAWNKLRNGEMPDAHELQSLEIAIRLLRPAPCSVAGALEELPDHGGHDLYPHDLKDAWARFQQLVQPYLYSIGRIDLADGRHVGTGFLVGDGVIATNRHVVDELTIGTGVLPDPRPVIAFQYEKETRSDPAQRIAIEGVIRCHDELDMALLAVSAPRKPLLPIAAATAAETQRVVAIGYPARDDARNPLFAPQVFGGLYGVKRASLGEVLSGSRTPRLFHDCSTLGGNSGSPIFDLESGGVIGIHRSGCFMYRNEAVDGYALREFVHA